MGNTVTTGSVTIPMMKKTGYKPEFAGAVEAAASTGGRSCPHHGRRSLPDGEFTGEPYGTIAMRAILPAVLYFTGIYIAVHLEAKKLGLKGIPREQLPACASCCPRSTFWRPWCCWWSWSPPTCTPWPSPLPSQSWRPWPRPGQQRGGDRQQEQQPGGLPHLRQDHRRPGGRRQGSITVAVACGVAGIISGCITVTGLASKLLSTIVSLSGGHMIIALALTMLCCIVLGMGVPTTANFCIMAATALPS
ncbi:MAG: TRAP transporter large permease subunit [Dysosmobacter welbionis]